MPKSSGQKLKLLYLRDILLKRTDDNHGMTAAEIIDALSEFNIKSERKSLYDDISSLQMYGLDIEKIKSNTTRYYVASRDFEIAELKLLVDAIQSSRFITSKKSMELIEKIENLVSAYQGRELKRNVFITNRVKGINEKIYYVVDALNSAISNDKKVSFKYMKWTLGQGAKAVKVPRRNGKLYVISPIWLCWDDENYYLIGYDSEADKIKHYRVDKIEDVKILDESREQIDEIKSFDGAEYTKKIFSMYGGEEVEVTMLVDNELVGVIADRFGENVFIVKENDRQFKFTARISISSQFFAWVFGLKGGVKILSPKKVADEFKAQLKAVNDNYYIQNNDI